MSSASSVVCCLPIGSEKAVVASLPVIQVQSFRDLLPEGIWMRFSERAKRVRLSHEGAYAQFRALWTVYNLMQIHGREPEKPLEENEIVNMAGFAYDAFDQAIDSGRYDLAVTIAFLIEKLPLVSVKKTKWRLIADLSPRGRLICKQEAVRALFWQRCVQHETIFESGDVEQAEYLCWVLDMMIIDHPFILRRDG